MFYRVEVSLRPELQDPRAQVVLENIRQEFPSLHSKIRWARILDVYWMDLPLSREEVIPALSEIFWDRVTQWMFTGNLIPAASGKSGGVNDLAEYAPHRPGKFWGIETRYRAGVTDATARVASEAFEIVLRKKIPGMQLAHGQLILLEGPELNEENLSLLSREVLCNGIVETWSLLDEIELRKSDRFHQERIRRDLPRAPVKVSDSTARKTWKGLSPLEVEKQAAQMKLGLTRNEAVALATLLESPVAVELRKEMGLPETPTRLEAEWVARWLTRSRTARISHAPIQYSGVGADFEVPAQWSSFSGQIDQHLKDASPKGWLRTDPRTGQVWMQLESEEWVCHLLQISSERLPHDPKGESARVLSQALQESAHLDAALQGVALSTGVFAGSEIKGESRESSLSVSSTMGVPAPRVIREVTESIEKATSSFGVPLVAGSQVRLPELRGKAVFFAGLTSVLPQSNDSNPLMEGGSIEPGDRLVFVGLPVSQQGVPLGLGSVAPERDPALQSFQRVDTLLEIRMKDLLAELRATGGVRSVGRGDSLADSILDWIERDRGSSGIKLDLERIPKVAGESGLSDSLFSGAPCHRVLAVSANHLKPILSLAESRGWIAEVVGEFTQTHRLDWVMGQKWLASLPTSDFFTFENPEYAKALPPIVAEWPEMSDPEGQSRNSSSPWFTADGRTAASLGDFGVDYLKHALSLSDRVDQFSLSVRCDQEGAGQTVIKAFHEAQVATPQSQFGPNDGTVLRISSRGWSGLALAQAAGIFPIASPSLDPYVKAQQVFDQVLRRALSVGGEYGRPESMMAFSTTWIWPNPKASAQVAGAWARAGMGLRDAAEAMGVPLIASAHSWTQQGLTGVEAVPGILSLNSLGRVRDVRLARSSDVKGAGDVIYLLGSGNFVFPGAGSPIPDWELARRIYSWVGGESSEHVFKVRTLREVGTGGLCTGLVESLMARGLGAHMQLPKDQDAWTFCFGEGFHHFLVFCAESEALALEESWSTQDLPFTRVGVVNTSGRLEVKQGVNSWMRFDVTESREFYSRAFAGASSKESK